MITYFYVTSIHFLLTITNFQITIFHFYIAITHFFIISNLVYITSTHFYIISSRVCDRNNNFQFVKNNELNISTIKSFNYIALQSLFFRQMTNETFYNFRKEFLSDQSIFLASIRNNDKLNHSWLGFYFYNNLIPPLKGEVRWGCFIFFFYLFDFLFKILSGYKQISTL